MFYFSKFLLPALLICGSLLHASDSAVTRYIQEKSSAVFRGDNLALKYYRTGGQNFLSADQKRQYGWCIVEANGKTVDGIRRAPQKNIVQFDYPSFPGLTQRFALQEDGTVRATLSAPDDIGSCRLQMRFFGEHFGKAQLLVDHRNFRLPPYREKAAFLHALYRGKAQKIVFFADLPDKRFEFVFDIPVEIKLDSIGGRWGIGLTIIPPPDAKSLSYRVILLREKNVCLDTPPREYTTRVGAYDFWREDHLRLPDRSAKNLLANSSFEQGFASLCAPPHGGGVVSRAVWEKKPIRIDTREAFDGAASLSILSDHRMAGLTQQIATHPVILEPGTYTVSFYAKTNCPGKQEIHFGSPKLPPGANIWDAKTRDNRIFSLTGQWERYTHTFRIDATQPHFFVFGANSPSPALCHIDAMQLEKGAVATAYEPAAAEGRLITSAPDNFLEAGKPVEARLEITTAHPGDSGTVETLVRNFQGTVVRAEKHDFCAGDNRKAFISLNLESMPPGIFTIENRYRLANGASRYEFYRFSVMHFLKNLHRHRFLFANVYIDPYCIRQYYPELLNRYRQIGIASRGAFVNTERLVAEEDAKYGVMPFSTALLRRDRSLEKNLPAPCAGFSVLSNVVWYETLSTEFRKTVYGSIVLPYSSPDALQSITRAAERRSRECPWVRIWCALNEPELNSPEFALDRVASESNFKQYAELELAVARGVRSGNPKALVGSSSTAVLNRDRLRSVDRLLTVLGDRLRYDCFVFHIYRDAPEYPDLDADLQAAFAMLKKHGYHNTPIYCSEGMHWKPYRMPGLISSHWVDVPWGPLSYDMGQQERIAAAKRARTWLVGLKNIDRVKQMNSSTNFGGFEMDFNLTPYANQKISNTLGRLLGNAVFKKEVHFSAKTRCYLFEDESHRPVAALWSCDPAVDNGNIQGPELTFHKLPDAELFDLMEAPQTFGKNMRLSSFPVFFRGKPGKTAELLAALEAAELADNSELAVSAVFETRLPSDYRLTFTNDRKRLLSGTVKIFDVSHKISLPPGKQWSLRGELPAILSDTRLCTELLRAEVRQEQPFPGMFTVQNEFAAVLARKAKISVDGEVDDWRGIPALPIDQRITERGAQRLAGTHRATLRLAWSPERLYLLCEVVDDVLKSNPRLQPFDGWRSDSMQVFFDAAADGRTNPRPELGNDDWSYGIYLTPGTFAPYVYRHAVPDIQLTEGIGGLRQNTVADDVECAFRRTANGYRFELGFPVRALLPFRPAVGRALGIGILLNNQNSDAKTPQSRLVWGLRAELYNQLPARWPLVILTDGNTGNTMK